MKFLVVLFAFCATAFARVPNFGRIVGGREVDITSFPHQVSVRIYDQHICGGSIINSNTILTAGHCVYNMNHNYYSVRIGNTDHSRGRYYEVVRVIENSNYNPSIIDHDMAILKLETSISFSDRAQPISLQPKGVEVPAGTTAFVSGWGATFEGSNVTPTNLRAVDVSVLTETDCSNKYGSGRITPRMFCAQTIGHDSCQGDSGGPLITGGRLVGVVSWGIGCARPNYPGVYAKVSNMYDWIIANSA